MKSLNKIAKHKKVIKKIKKLQILITQGITKKNIKK